MLLQERRGVATLAIGRSSSEGELIGYRCLALWIGILPPVFVFIGASNFGWRTGSVEPMLGGGLMLQCIAAAVIGGVRLRGGEGHVVHCVLGAVFVTMLSNGMNLVRVDGYMQMIVLGIVVVTGVFIDRLRVYLR